MLRIALKGAFGTAGILGGRWLFARGHVVPGAIVVGVGAVLVGNAITDAAFWGLEVKS